MIDPESLDEMGFDYYRAPDYKSPLSAYSEWVEGKMLTEGHDRLVENTLGLVGEAGEVAEKIKKKIRDNAKVSSEEIMKELGDVLFYTTALANFYAGSLGLVMEFNVHKLDDREKRNKLQGNGDNR